MTLTMKRMPIGFALGVFLLCTGQVTTIRAGEQPKQFVLISIDVPGYPSLAPQGINDSGDIAGQIIDAQGVIRHGFLMRPGEAAVIKDHYVKAAASMPEDKNYFLNGVQTASVVRSYLLTRKGVEVPGEASEIAVARFEPRDVRGVAKERDIWLGGVVMGIGDRL